MVDNWPLSGNNIINTQPELAQLSSHEVPAGYQLTISLENDAKANVTGAKYAVVDNHGHTIGSKTINLLSLNLASGAHVTSADLAPVIAFQLNLVGYLNGDSTVLSSGQGTITYDTANALAALSSEPPCAESGYITAETANSFYGQLPSSPSTELTQSFTESTATPMIRKVGKIRPSTPRK